MSRIIQHRKLIEGQLVRERQFDWEGSENHGYAFECDEQGNPTNLNDVSRESFAKCVANSFKDEDGNPSPIVDKGIRTWKAADYYEPAILKCDCENHVELYGFTNTCAKCEADYNMSGQRLADRSQWGEETSESVSDILAADSDDWDYGCP